MTGITRPANRVSFVPFYQPLKAGIHYRPIGSVTQTQFGEATTLAVPFFVTSPVVLTAISCQVQTAGSTGAVFRLGIYKDDGTGYPGGLLFDAGTVNTESTGVKTLTISQAVPAGLVWLAGAQQGAPTTRAIIYSLNTRTPGMGDPTTPSATNPGVSYSEASVAGAFPTTFTATQTQQGTAPVIWIKV